MIPFITGCVASGYSGLDSGSYGIKSRPVVYRVLIPIIAKVAHSIIPEAIEQPLTEKMIHWRDSEEGKKTINSFFLHAPPLTDDKIFESAVAAFVAYLTLLAFIWMLYTLACALFPESSAYALYAPLIALQLLLALTVRNSYIYDFAELFFSCALFYLLFKQRWGLYMVTLVFAVLNKETALFSIFFYAIWFYPRLPRKQYIQLFMQQLLIYGAIKTGINTYFSDMPGVVFYNHFLSHIEYAAQHIVTTTLLVIATIGVIWYKWNEKPTFLCGGLWMALPNLAAYLLFCSAGEYRDLYWIVPILVLHATYAMMSYGGFADLPVFCRPEAKAKNPL